jgi:hypothetical protein
MAAFTYFLMPWPVGAAAVPSRTVPNSGRAGCSSNRCRHPRDRDLGFWRRLVVRVGGALLPRRITTDEAAADSSARVGTTAAMAARTRRSLATHKGLGASSGTVVPGQKRSPLINDSMLNVGTRLREVGRRCALGTGRLPQDNVLQEGPAITQNIPLA